MHMHPDSLVSKVRSGLDLFCSTTRLVVAFVWLLLPTEMVMSGIHCLCCDCWFCHIQPSLGVAQPPCCALKLKSPTMRDESIDRSNRTSSFERRHVGYEHYYPISTLLSRQPSASGRCFSPAPNKMVGDFLLKVSPVPPAVLFCHRQRDVLILRSSPAKTILR